MAVGKAFRVMKNFYKKQCLPVITWNKKHSLKKVISITYTPEKMFFAAATFEGLRVLFFWSKKIVVDFGLYESSLYFCVILYQVKTVYKKPI